MTHKNGQLSPKYNAYLNNNKEHSQLLRTSLSKNFLFLEIETKTFPFIPSIHMQLSSTRKPNPKKNIHLSLFFPKQVHPRNKTVPNHQSGPKRRTCPMKNGVKSPLSRRTPYTKRRSPSRCCHRKS